MKKILLPSFLIFHFSPKRTGILLFLIFQLCSTLFILAQTRNEDSTWIANHYTKIERMIPMRDGIRLFTAIYLPNNDPDGSGEKHPVLLMRTPYSCGPYGENKYTDRYSSRGDSVYFHRNYILVWQDVRGRYMSEGTFEDVRPFIPNKKKKTDVDEASDTYDAIDWLVKNVKNNNGNVGVYGISYPGFYATEAALCGHPALKAVSPQAPVTDWFMGDDFHHKGVPFTMDAFDFYRGFGVPRPKPLEDYPPIPEVKYPDNYNFFLQNGTYHELKEKYMGDSIKFLNDVAVHPDYDDWWQSRNARVGCYNVKPAILVVGGLFDAEDCYGAWNLYKAIRSQSPNTVCKIVEGPWIHGGWAKTAGDRLGNIYFGGKTSWYYRTQFELPFFEYYLRGKGGVDQIKEANVFITGEDKWFVFDQWPPKNVLSSNLFLQQNGNLSFTKPTYTNSSDEYTSDPMHPVPYTEDVGSGRTREYMCDDQRFASRRPDVLTYESDALNENITLTGPVLADLFVSLSTTDADFVVKLIDVYPDDFKYPDSVKIIYPIGGYQMLVRGEIMRGRFRNNFSVPEAFIPEQISEVKFELPDVAHTFLKGHRIMIQIQSSWFPLADRNPQQFIDTYHCGEKDLVKCTVNVFHDSVHASSIILPVLKQ
ncbi:MAG TPA: CocE/NonD family hydrolase [Chitinophagales bacterium]|nr:CocE/NonD family hydrolase [Chitinophagales bacterium]